MSNHLRQSSCNVGPDNTSIPNPVQCCNQISTNTLVSSFQTNGNRVSSSLDDLSAVTCSISQSADASTEVNDNSVHDQHPRHAIVRGCDDSFLETYSVDASIDAPYLLHGVDDIDDDNYGDITGDVEEDSGFTFPIPNTPTVLPVRDFG